MSAVRRTITVSITPEQDALLRACLHSGRYRNVSEVMRTALRLFECDEAAALATVRASKAKIGSDRA